MNELKSTMSHLPELRSITLDKMNEKCEKIEARVDALEKEQPMNKQVVDWVLRAVYAVVAAAAMAAAKLLGLF